MRISEGTRKPDDVYYFVDPRGGVMYRRGSTKTAFNLFNSLLTDKYATNFKVILVNFRTLEILDLTTEFTCSYNERMELGARIANHFPAPAGDIENDGDTYPSDRG